jgi:hypothetical protein
LQSITAARNFPNAMAKMYTDRACISFSEPSSPKILLSLHSLNGIS